MKKELKVNNTKIHSTKNITCCYIQIFQDTYNKHHLPLTSRKMQAKTKLLQEDSLYDLIPTIGIEGLIATIEDEKKLLQALEKEITQRTKILTKWKG